MMVSRGSDAPPVLEADLSPQQCAPAEADRSDLTLSKRGKGEAVPLAALGRWLTGSPAAGLKYCGPTVPPR